MSSLQELEPFLDKEYRDSYLDGYVKSGLALQMQALRHSTGLSQTAFGEKVGKPQSVISRLEDTEYGSVSVQTLVDIAKALSICLDIRFIEYAAMLSSKFDQTSLNVRDINYSYQELAALTKAQDVAFSHHTNMRVQTKIGQALIIETSTTGGISVWPTRQSQLLGYQGSGTPNIETYTAISA